MNRARTNRWFALGAAAALLAASPPAFAGKKDNSVQFAYQDTLDSADPYYNVLLVSTILASQVWDTLIYRDPETGAYKGNLATAWRQIDDKTLEFDLRQGVKFHNGAEFDADDVVYTFNFVSDPKNKAVAIRFVHWIDRVEKLGKYKVRILAKQPFPAAIEYLAAPNVVIHPHDYYSKVGPVGMSARPIGTGPYRVVEHALGKHIRLERNPDYFKGSPKAQPTIDKVDIRFIPDAQTRVAEMVAGSADLIARVDRDQAEQLRGIPSLRIVSGTSNIYAYLQMNTLPATPAPQLRDVRVRQAIMHAIDRDTMVKYLVGNNSRALHAECYPDQFGCEDANVPRYAFDPGKARKLLAETGYPNGFDIDLYAWKDRNQAEAIVGYLSSVNIRAHLRFMQGPAMASLRRAGKVGLNISAWGSAINDSSATVSVFHEFSADDLNKDPEIRDLLLRGDSAMDPNTRKEAYAKGLRLIAERAYVLPLFSLPTYYVVAKDLAFKPYRDEIPRFNEMSWK